MREVRDITTCRKQKSLRFVRLRLENLPICTTFFCLSVSVNQCRKSPRNAFLEPRSFTLMPHNLQFCHERFSYTLSAVLSSIENQHGQVNFFFYRQGPKDQTNQDI